MGLLAKPPPVEKAKITITMASQITDPKDFAQHINENLLAEFLGAQNPKIAFDVKGEKTEGKKRVSKDVVERFIKAIEGLEDRKKAQWLFNEMLYINALSEQRHITNLENQANEDGITFDIEDYGKCVCHDERALWWYIHHKNVFDKYFERAETENLAGLKELIINDKNIVKKEKIDNQDKLIAFGEEVAKIYENVLRGKKFRASHFSEKDCVFVRVYLENLPENQLVFIDNKEKQSAIGRTPSVRSLFNTLFVYSPDEKTLGIRTTNPAENVPKLAELFGKTFLNCTYADMTERKYNVESKGSIEKLELTPEPMSDIERCYLKAVEYGRIGDITKTLRLDVGGRQNHTGVEAMREFIKQSKIVESEWQPKKFELKFIFKKVDEAKGRKRQITAHLTKRGHNLKNTPEDQKIRSFLKAKGFIS
jgi:hypothetical protein